MRRGEKKKRRDESHRGRARTRIETAKKVSGFGWIDVDTQEPQEGKGKEGKSREDKCSTELAV